MGNPSRWSRIAVEHAALGTTHILGRPLYPREPPVHPEGIKTIKDLFSLRFRFLESVRLPEVPEGQLQQKVAVCYDRHSESSSGQHHGQNI